MITSAATALKVLGVNPTYADYIAQPLEHHYVEAANDLQTTSNDNLRNYFLSAAVSRAQQARKDYLASEKEIITAELIHDDTHLKYVETYCNDTNSVSYTHLTLPTTLHECRSRWSPYR